MITFAFVCVLAESAMMIGLNENANAASVTAFPIVMGYHSAPLEHVPGS